MWRDPVRSRPRWLGRDRHVRWRGSFAPWRPWRSPAARSGAGACRIDGQGRRQGGGQIAARRSGTRRSVEGCRNRARWVETCFQGGIGVRIAVEQVSKSRARRRSTTAARHNRVSSSCSGSCRGNRPASILRSKIRRSASGNGWSAMPSPTCPVPFRQCPVAREANKSPGLAQRTRTRQSGHGRLIPTIDIGRGHRRFNSVVPLDQGTLEHFSVEDLLRGEVMQQACVADADSSAMRLSDAIESTFGEETLRGDDDRVLRGQPTHGREP